MRRGRPQAPVLAAALAKLASAPRTVAVAA
jgi:hypothetical protein